MIEFQNEDEKAVWREQLLTWEGLVEKGFEMADRIVLAYRERCPKTLNLNCTMHFDPSPFNFCDAKPFPVSDIRIVLPKDENESTNNKETE